MTQEEEITRKVEELNDIFLGLNEKGRDSALIILRTLDFAQGVIYQTECQQPIRRFSSKEVGGKENVYIAKTI